MSGRCAVPTPVISVVIPVYNASATLARCLDSVLEQHDPAVELVVVDDGSLDDSLRIAQSYERTRANVRVLQQRNAGPSAARNAGIDACAGDWLLMLDADDVQEPRALATLRASMDDCIDVIMFPVQKVLSSGRVLREPGFTKTTDAHGMAQCILMPNGPYQGYTHNKCVRTSVARSAGPLNQDFRYCEDEEWWLRVAATLQHTRKSDRCVRVLDEYLYNYSYQQMDGLRRGSLLKVQWSARDAILDLVERTWPDLAYLARQKHALWQNRVVVGVVRSKDLRNAALLVDVLRPTYRKDVYRSHEVGMGTKAKTCVLGAFGTALGAIGRRRGTAPPSQRAVAHRHYPCGDEKPLSRPVSKETSMASSKTLTISIAAYNVASTIEKCLQSCLDAPNAHKLDIIVVDDGSSDTTAEVAEAYAQRHPDVVRVVSKTNAGYGSTFNTSIELARGRYFRLLDGDDWVDANALGSLVDKLDGVDVDVAIAPYVECYDTQRNVVDEADHAADGEVPFAADLIPYKLGMHSIYYRTELVRTSGLKLPERRLYTDTLYNVVPLQLVRTAFVSHEPVYQYRMGQVGQSVSKESLEAHRADMRAVVDDLMAFHASLSDRNTLAARIAMTWLSADAAWLCRILLGMKASPTQREELADLVRATRRDPLVHAACRARSKVYCAVDTLPPALYPFVARVYRRSRR